MRITEELIEACRNLRNYGSLASSKACLRELARTFTPAQAAELHAFFRDESQRFESEWRAEFLALFPQASGLLPEIDESEFWQDQLFALIRAGELPAVQAFIARIGTADQQFDPGSTYSECSGMGFVEQLPGVPFDFYPIEGGDESGTTAVELARELGAGRIAAYLEEVIARLDQRYFEAYRAGRDLHATMRPEDTPTFIKLEILSIPPVSWTLEFKRASNAIYEVLAFHRGIGMVTSETRHGHASAEHVAALGAALQSIRTCPQSGDRRVIADGYQVEVILPGDRFKFHTVEEGANGEVFKRCLRLVCSEVIDDSTYARWELDAV